MDSIKKKLFNNFVKFINEQDADSEEVCMFIYSLLHESNFHYYPTGFCYNELYRKLERGVNSCK